MTEPGALIAKGRAADVFAYGDRHVLRRYRTDHDSLYEAAVMQHVASFGYPVPEVVSAGGRDLVMERLDGPTMLSDMSKHPWRMWSHVRTLAGLIHRLHEVPPPSWLARRHVDGDVVVHLDLHPDNVMLTSRGPVVIDWSNAGIGDGDTEVADLWLILACADAPVSGTFDRLLITAGRRLLLGRLLRHFDVDGIRRKLRGAFVLRSSDRNMSEAEKARMTRLVERSAL